MKYINVAEANCKNCHRCLKVCPVKSIKFSDNKVEVMEDECILCGRCIRNCPQHAKSLVHDIAGIKQTVRNSARKKIAALAPSYLTSFGTENRYKLAGALQSLGFYAVEETAVGAHAVTKEYARILESDTMDNMITTCCPSIVFLVQKHFPKLTQYLAPVLSPIYIDGVVTFKQLAEWFAEDGVNLSEAQEGYFGNDPSASAIYPVFEGIVKDVKANLPEDSHVFKKYAFMSKQGAKDVFELFTEMNEGRLHNCFIETSACYGSCINGPEKLDEGYYPVSNSMTVMRYLREEKNIREADLSDIDLSREIRPAPPKRDIPDEKTIRAILAQIGKTKPEHEINCGSCGYRTCRDKAIAVYQGKAELHMCLPYMTQISETLANVTLSVSPDYIIAVDRDLHVKEWTSRSPSPRSATSRCIRSATRTAA